MKKLLMFLVLVVIILLLVTIIVSKAAYKAEQLQQLEHTLHQMCPAPPLRQMTKQETIDQVVFDYQIDRKLASDIVEYAYKYQRDTFPRAHDIIAIIGVESDFRPTAKSKLKTDPAYGLTQVRTQMWKHLDQCKNVKTNVEQQVRCGAFILAAYYKELGVEQDAVLAYNIGLAAFQRGDNNPRYVPKYQRQLNKYQTYYQI